MMVAEAVNEQSYTLQLMLLVTFFISRDTFNAEALF